MKIKVICIAKYLNFFINNQNKGYTLIELVCMLMVMGIIGILVAPQFVSNQVNATTDGRSQIKGILQQSRGRAVSSTSAVRIKADSVKTDTKFVVEIANTRGCESITKLRQNANGADLDLRVNSISGFAVGDRIKVGSDSTNNIILAIDSTNAIITLGQPLGTNQSTNSNVELADNWKGDLSFLVDDLTLPQKAKFTSDITDWTICFNSRGIASIYDNSNGNQKSDITLTVKNISNNDQKTITVLKGGAIKNN